MASNNNIAPDRTPVSNAITEAQESATIDSDTEYDEQVLQITFDSNLQANRRRRASLVHCEGGNPLYAQALPNSCFVHTLLETQKDRKYARRNSLVKEFPRKDFPLIKDGVEGTHKSLPLMTKSELADMVLGVRELSKHLSSVQIKMEVRTVLILTKTHDKTLIGCTRKLAEWLLSPERDYPYTVYVERCFAEKPEFDLKGLLDQHPSYKPRLKYWNAELCARRPHTFDFITTLGGDGTVLFASWLFQKVVPPVFSFSLGSLGFLTKFDFHTFEDSLQRAFNEGVTVGLRLRFEGTIMRSIKNAKSISIDGESIDRDITNEILSTHKEITHHPDETYIVLNEIVVDRGPNPTMSSTELYGDDMHLSNIEADGLCIATPTGSTAYNLAAGGSLCHPEIPAMLVSPICAHSLSFRPLILPDSMVLRVAVPYNARTTAWVSFDGRQRIELQQGDFVMITASRFPFPTVQCKRDNKDWFDSIRRTMNWGSRIRQQGGSGHE